MRTTPDHFVVLRHKLHHCFSRCLCFFFVHSQPWEFGKICASKKLPSQICIAVAIAVAKLPKYPHATYLPAPPCACVCVCVVFLSIIFLNARVKDLHCECTASALRAQCEMSILIPSAPSQYPPAPPPACVLFCYHPLHRNQVL